VSGRGRLLAGLAVLGIGVAGFVTYSVLSGTTPTTPPAPTEPAACKPPDDLRSTNIAREERANGASEVTEFVAGGEYRVTRCDSDGDLLVSQTVSPIRAPDGDVAVVPTKIERPGSTVSVLYGDPDDPRWAADFKENEAALRGSTIAPTEPPPRPPAAVVPNTPAAATAGRRSAQVGSDACTNRQFVRLGDTFRTRSYNYRINRARFDFNATTIRSIVRGHTNWDSTRNSCGLRDITRLTSRHLGSTSATAHLNNPDGQSVTDKGSMAGVMGCSIAAIACTIQFTGPNNTAVETDQRFNTRYRYSNAGAAGAYDYQAVTTHETGHSIGLDHANSSSALTMFFQVLTGTTHARSLARGDVRGLRARYP